MQLTAPKTSSLNEELDDAKIKQRMSSFKEALAKIVDGRPHAVFRSGRFRRRKLVCRRWPLHQRVLTACVRPTVSRSGS